MKKEIRRLPPWLVQKTPPGGHIHQMKSTLRARRLHTVCESARCPNIGRCFARPTATFMILGDRCTRRCGFCAVESGPPPPVDREEPEKLARTAFELGLNHVVITSVTRDDLGDGGASHFLRCAHAVKEKLPASTVELLTPDFQGDGSSRKILQSADFDVFNHNLETVPRLYRSVRPQADYGRSLGLLRTMKAQRPDLLTKSGLMVGLGETIEEVLGVFHDLVENGVDAVTVGQYLQPTRNSLPVTDYLHPEVFEEMTEAARAAGLKYVACQPLVRSSFNADLMMQEAFNKRSTKHSET